MPTATSMAQLTKMLQDHMRKAMQEVQSRVEVDMFEEVGKYYTGGTPVLYQRTGTLGSSPRTTNLSGGGNVISFDAYLDQSGGYEGENARLQAMGFKSYFSTLQAYTAAEHGTDHVKGNPGFWARSEQRMQQELDSVMGSYFN